MKGNGLEEMRAFEGNISAERPLGERLRCRDDEIEGEIGTIRKLGLAAGSIFFLDVLLWDIFPE